MPKTICIIENDDDLLTLLRFSLQRKGFHVITQQVNKKAPSIQSFVQEADLYLVDLNLGILDGAELCKQLKQNPRNGPVILVSGNPQVREIARECQADSFIDKPFTMPHLVAMVNVLTAPEEQLLQ